MKFPGKLLWLLLSMLFFDCACLASSVVLTPSSAQVNLGAQLQFSASGGGVIVWGLSGSGCSGTSCGSITSDGLYTAPLIAPNPATVSLVATSLADLTQSATASITIGSQPVVAVRISPVSATIVQGGQQQFFATVTGTSNTAVNWAVTGAGCVAPLCGTINVAGLYTAPAVIPKSAHPTVTATSKAAPTKSASATVVIEAATAVSVSVSPSTVQVNVGAQQQFSATVRGATNTSVKWTVAGTGCSGATCGSISSSGLYTAPANVPPSSKVTVTATSVAAPGRASRATVTIVAASAKLTVYPSSSQIKPGAQMQFTATGPGSQVVIWGISGSGCSGTACGVISSTGLYTAPATAPNLLTITVIATSLMNPDLTGSAMISITSFQIGVTVSPGSVQLSPNAQQLFKATVSGTTNTAVHWSLSGYGCAGSACGTITSGGLYTAPSTPPSSSIVFVTATSTADSTKSDTATVTIAPPIGISVSPSVTQVAVSGNQQFTAKVTGTTISSVTWSVSGPGCSGAACGSVSSAGLYTAPATAPNPATVSVTATSDADHQTSASAIVTILVPVSVSISPTNATVTVGEQLQFRSEISGTTNKNTAWSISGSGCTGSTCGTISSAGLYIAPASVPSQTTVIVKATSVVNTSASASAVVTIVPSNNAKLVGRYAFLFTGFNSQGVYQEAGSVQADGNGKLLMGLEDVNDTANPSTNMSITGTYQVGPDNRGVMTINGPLGTHVFRFALNLLGTRGRLISFDQSGVRGSGVIYRQDPTAFSTGVVAGGYVLNLAGTNVTGARIGALGIIFPSGDGFVSGSSLDVNEGGVVSPTFATFSGTYGVDPTGRGTMTLSIPGFDGGTFNFAFYVVSANELLLVSVDPLSLNNPIFSGTADLQTGAPFTTASFNGGSVFELSGTNGTSADDTVGRLQFNSGGNVVMNFDRNNGGLLTLGGVMTGAYDVQLNGRGTLNLANPDDGSRHIWYLYAIAPNKAFVMDASTGAVSVGELTPQAAALPFSNSTLLGTYLFGSDEPIVEGAPLYSGVANFDGGSNISGLGSVSGVEDISQIATQSPNQVLSGTYFVSAVSNNGRGALLLASPANSTIAVWVCSETEFFALGIDPTTTQPTILHFEQ